jgi:xanthine/uracil/vitamin C permease (AzgA family)
MELNTRATGSMTNNTAKERSTGQMALSMKETINSERRMVLVNSSGPINRHTAETSLTIIFTDTADTDGLMVASTAETGFATKCTELVSLPGQMEENMMVSISTTRNKVMECSPGQTEDNTTVHG